MRQVKNITEGELRTYKAKLEEEIEKGTIGLQGWTRTSIPGIRFASIEMAEESSWFDMSEHGEEDFTLFSYSWTGATGEARELPPDKITDPILDVTLLNGDKTAVISRVGVIAKRSYQKLAGFSPPERIAVFEQHELEMRWIIGEPQWMLFRDGPLHLQPGSPYRFKLRLKNYAKVVPNNYGVISVVCQSDTGVIESDGICLGA